MKKSHLIKKNRCRNQHKFELVSQFEAHFPWEKAAESDMLDAIRRVMEVNCESMERDIRIGSWHWETASLREFWNNKNLGDDEQAIAARNLMLLNCTQGMNFFLL